MKTLMVLIATSMGDVTVELYPEKAPATVENFIEYVKADHYDGTVFHRVIKDFMIQGGGFTPDLAQKPTRKPVQNEAYNGLANREGTIAMARTNDPHSATAQFFINTESNGFLDHRAKEGQYWGYTVFGKVVSGMDVVEKIERVPTGVRNRMQDVPVTPVVINDIRILETPAK